MFSYVFRRMLMMIPTLVVISMVIFVIIQLPPGDYLESYIAELQAQGESVDLQKIEFLRQQYGLDQPLWQQYVQWVAGIFQGDFGYSFEYQHAGVRGHRRPAAADDGRLVRHHPLHLGDRVPDRRLLGDPPVQLGRLRPHAPRLPRPRDAQLPAGAGPDVPRQRLFGTSIGGLMDPEYIDKPWSWEKCDRCSSTSGSR